METQTNVNNLIAISDTHIFSRAGLIDPSPFKLDDGGTYTPSDEQMVLWDCWLKFWNEWVPFVTKKEPFAVLANGDLLEGVHHGTKHNISDNYADQEAAALRVLEPIVEKCQGRFYVTRGTEAHAGKSGE